MSTKLVNPPNPARSYPVLPTEPCAHPLRIAAIALIIGTSAVASAQSGTGFVRVSPSGFDSAGCGSEGSPCRTVQQAVDNTTTGDVVLVAQGTYSGTTNCLGSPAVVCVLNQQVTIRGGFPTGTWTNPTPHLTPTVLDGLDSNRVVLAQDTTPGGASSASLTLDGVTVTRGFVRGAASGDDVQITAFGAGINATNCPIYLTDVVISDNRIVGGGSVSSQPDDHGGAGAGGGIALLGTVETSVLTRVRFEGNTAEGGARSQTGSVRGGYAQGGGLFIYLSPLNGFDLEFVDNVAVAGDASSGSGSDASGEEADAQGAGICVQYGSTVTIDGLSATGNVATGGDASSSSGSLGGGGFGAVLFAEQATVTVRDFDVWSNESRGGFGFTGGLGASGGFMSYVSTFVADRGFARGNLSHGGAGASVAGSAGGGAFYIVGTPSTTFQIINTVIADNEADDGDSGAPVGGGGGGLFLQGAEGSVIHGTIAGNRLGNFSLDGQGAVIIAGAGPSDVSFDYTIFADHVSGTDAALHVQPGNSARLDTGLFANNTTDTVGGGTITGLDSMISAVAAGFTAPGAPSFDYHILQTSSAVDNAVGSTTALDVDGQARSIPDIGADELDSAVFADGFELGDTSRWSSTG